MPPRARRIRASAPGPALGPMPPPPAPPPAVQQHSFIPPSQPPPFQPLHAGGDPVPGDNSQYHTASLDANAPPAYAHPHGAHPYGAHPHGAHPYGAHTYGAHPYGAHPHGAQPYGMPPYGAPLAYPPPLPHFASYPGNAQLQPWGYGHYPTGQLPNPVPHPVATRPDEQAEVQDHAAIAPDVAVVGRDVRTATSMREGRDKSMAVQQKKNYPNKEVSEGVWRFRVEVDREVRQTFAAQTDMTWPEFEAEALEWFNAREDVCLGYRVSGDNRGWISLTCPSDWKVAVANVREKALAARTRAVTMEIKDVSTLNRPKIRGKGKGKGKRSRDDDIPPEATPEAKSQDNHLLNLQSHLLCNACSKSSGEMTNWAKLIEIKKATRHLRPNIMPYDRPPTKKPKAARAAPEVHIAVSITPTSGVGASQSSYVVSGSQVTRLGSSPGPSHATQVSDVVVHTEAPAPAPTENRSPSPPAYTSLDLLWDCYKQERVPFVYEILNLMDVEEPVPGLTYLDSHTDLFNFGYNDALELFVLDESLLSGFGLGTENARRVHRFIRDRFFEPLVAAPTAPMTQLEDTAQHDDGVKGKAMAEETEIWLTIPGDVIEEEGATDIEEDEIDKHGSKEEEIDEIEEADEGSDIEIVTMV
ncbi:hypothetical protein EDB89DRAFT_2083020 [Lactarius sanguifluus]|nr:hypothetical protein EDB89DRAFT_2083020 [Lactarius sanguifluus]